MCVLSSHYSGRQASGRTSRVTQEEGHTGFLIYLPSAVLALIVLARRIQSSLSLVDRQIEFCVLANYSFSTSWAFFILFFCEEKSQFV